MPRKRSPAYDDQRALILSNAAQLFAQRGCSATSMNEVADACGLSKPSVYYYFRDKYALLVDIAEEHVSRLEFLVQEVEAAGLAPDLRLRELIARFVREYASAHNAHCVLTEEVKFLEDADRERILGAQSRVVAGFARAVAELRPDLKRASLTTPLTMLLFGMINWMFMWLRPHGKLGHEVMAPVVTDLFFGGLPAVRQPRRS